MEKKSACDLQIDAVKAELRKVKEHKDSLSEALDIANKRIEEQQLKLNTSFERFVALDVKYTRLCRFIAEKWMNWDEAMRGK